IFAIAETRAAAQDLLETFGPVAAPHAVCRFEEEALRHLFRVTASLDSMVVGEAQILGQVKDAALQAQRAGALGPELSRALARAAGGVHVSLAELPALLERADVAICSTSASQAVVTRDMMAKALKARRYRPIFLVDLTLPRNVEPSANELENVYVYDLDDLERVAAQNRDLRAAHVGKAEEIVEEELKAFLTMSRERAAVPVLARLRAHA